MSIYYGQEGQDSLITQFFEKKGVQNGFYLDVGSVDGIYYSNTYALEKSGWNGICVEGHPSYFPMLEQNRTATCYSCAAGDEDKGECTFSANYRGSLSTLDLNLEKWYPNSGYKKFYGDRKKPKIKGILNGRITVPMRKLDSILEENQEKFDKLDLISIDVDGSEIYTLKGLTLENWMPTLLILEISMVRDFVHKFATSAGYILARTCGPDAFYVKTKEDADLLKSLKVKGKRINRKHPSEFYKFE